MEKGGGRGAAIVGGKGGGHPIRAATGLCTAVRAFLLSVSFRWFPRRRRGVRCRQAQRGRSRRRQGRASVGSDKVLPFEFMALEVCLEFTCESLEHETCTLEKEAYPALDELSSKIRTGGLQVSSSETAVRCQSVPGQRCHWRVLPGYSAKIGGQNIKINLLCSRINIFLH
uniref:Uncharacterized protein n=1 Tax=Arundo donax TaxID=35708 RepID=A0A0A9G2P3_ARUDO